MKIFTVTHKVSKKIASAPLYEFLLVGADKNKGLSSYLQDNSETDNISSMNGSFCELTGMYWMWKHHQDDIIGLVHYRRFFVTKKSRVFQKRYILDEETIRNDLDNYDIILSQRGNNEFKGEKAGEFFKRVHDPEVWENCRIIITELYPEYLEDFEWFEQEKIGYICNMFICDNKLFSEYCEWLFDILFKLDLMIDYSKYTNYNRRMIGFVGERLFNVWVHHNQLRVKEYPIYVTENEFHIKVKRKWQRLMFELKKILGKLED